MVRGKEDSLPLVEMMAPQHPWNSVPRPIDLQKDGAVPGFDFYFTNFAIAGVAVSMSSLSMKTIP